MNPILNGSVQAKAFCFDLIVIGAIIAGLAWLVVAAMKAARRRSRAGITKRCWRPW